MHPVLAYLSGFAVCDQFVGVQGNIETQVVVNHYLEGFSLYAFPFVFVNRFGFQISLRPVADTVICVPEKETFKIQELHLPVYHALCAILEAELFEERKN